MRNKLIAYAMHFASFLVEKGISARRILLFGSVASGDFDDRSDVDIFVDIDKRNEKEMPGLVSSFEKAFGEKWRLKGVNNQLSVTVGSIASKEWEDLRRTIQSYGITLYGQYNEQPENIQSYILFSLGFRKLGRANKVSLWRKLYGYAQKVGKKSYKSRGLIEQLGGAKLDKCVVLIPAANSSNFKKFLGKNSISYRLIEVWSDQLADARSVPEALQKYLGKKRIG